MLFSWDSTILQAQKPGRRRIVSQGFDPLIKIALLGDWCAELETNVKYARHSPPGGRNYKETYSTVGTYDKKLHFLAPEFGNFLFLAQNSGFWTFPAGYIYSF